MNLLFADLHAIDIIFVIIVFLHIQFSGVDTAFSQSFSLSSYNQTSHLFSRTTSQNHSVLSSDEHFLNFDLSTDHKSTPPTPNRDDYSLIVNDTLVSSPRQDPRF